jgi:superfamily II DNA/RNA helicase
LSSEDNNTEQHVLPFGSFNLDPTLVDGLAAAGIHTTFPIQALTLPLALSGNDIIGQAKTGTGKTLGFGLPLLQAVLKQPRENSMPRALVVVPTRELALQVAKDLQVAASKTDLRIEAFFGGRAYEPQVAAIEKGVDVVVGTPGRLIDLTKQKHLNFNSVRVLVLDEADEMLDMGFLPDVERILAQTPASRQTMLFSATMPGVIIGMARTYMSNPTHIRAIDATSDSTTVDSIEQHVWRAHPMDKPELIGRILQAEGRNLCIIFCKTKRSAQRLFDDLEERGFAVGAIHGDLGQGAREQALRALRAGKIDVMVATDVAARGIDVEGVTHVINYECPDDEKTYLHRVGRTGRAGADGVAITLVDWNDVTRWQVINKTLGLAFNDPIETYSNSPHVFTGLNIPEGTKGRLKKASQTRAGLDAEALENVGGKKSESKPRRDGGRDGGRGRGDRNDRPRGERSDKPRNSDAATSDAPKSDAPRKPRPPRQRRRVAKEDS